MKETPFTWTTHIGTHFGRGWRPEGKIQGAIALIHGLGEHSGRYHHVASSLTTNGMAIMALDLQGHGKTTGKRGHIISYSSLLTDIHHLLTRIKEVYPQKPIFLYGHSLGGNLVLNYALTYPEALKGVIVTSPWIKLAFEPSSLQVLLAKLMNYIYPAFTQNNQIKEGTLSHNEEVEKAYRNDPLVHNQISARLFLEAYGRGLWALKKANDFTRPLLLLHGTGDQLTSWKASQLFSQGAKDCTFQPYKGLYHELHNEREKEEVFALIINWIKKQTTHK